MPAPARSTRVPSWVPFFNYIAKPLLAAGVPMGPDVLITVRGRKSGLLRTTPVTIAENSGRRGLISPFGETNWVRNLRAAGRATITVGRRKEEVTAIELGPTEAAEFIRDVLAPHARRTRLGSWFVRSVDKIDIDNPVEAAEGRPIFELYPAKRRASPADLGHDRHHSSRQKTGDKDVRSPISVGQALHAQIPRSKLVVIPGAGHVTNLEAPDRFNAEVRSFLRGARS